MSLEHVKAYAACCVNDDGARVRAKEIGHDDLDGHIAHAKEQGFDISADDMNSLRDELVASGDLTDQQLEAAAGGTPTLMAAAAAVSAAAGVVSAGAAVATSTTGTGW